MGHFNWPLTGLLEELATLHPIPALGIQIGMRGEIQDAGILGYLAASCDSLVGVLGILPPYIAKPSEAPVCRGL
ncbi:hypothetical protein MOXK23_23110 (plasmid) [Moraxella sp. K23]